MGKNQVGAPKNFPDAKTRNNDKKDNWTKEIIPFISLSKQIDTTNLGKFLGDLGKGIVTCSVFFPFIFIFGQCEKEARKVLRLNLIDIGLDIQ